MPLERFLTAEQVAVRVNVSIRTVERWAARDEISSVLIGGHRRFPEGALAKFLERKGLAKNEYPEEG